MNTGGEAAEQIVRMSLEGLEVAAKISGAGAKNIAALLYAILKEETKTRGKARLSPLLRSGKELKVFTIKREDLKKFTKEAKKYGVLYRVLVDRQNKNPDAEVDIIARAEDAPKINRIVERFRLASVDAASIAPVTEKGGQEGSGQPEADVEMQKSAEKEELLDALMGKSEEAEESRPNPSEAEKELSPPSEPGSRPSGKSEEVDFGADTNKKEQSLVKEKKPPIKKAKPLGKEEKRSVTVREKKPSGKRKKSLTKEGKPSCSKRKHPMKEEKPSVREAIQNIQKNRQRQRADIPSVPSRRAASDQTMKSPSKRAASGQGKRSPGRQAVPNQTKRDQIKRTGRRQSPKGRKPGRTRGAR